MSNESIAPPVGPKRQSHKICLLGSEGSGKTCFLAGLAILREPNRNTSLTITCQDNRTIKYLDELADTLRKGQWPPPTNMTTQLRLRIGKDRQVIEALLVDYPGEDFRAALAKLRLEEIEELHQHFVESETILLLFDPERDVRASGDPVIREQQIERQLAHLQAIADVWAERLGKSRQSAPHFNLAIVVTKADTEPALVNPQATRHFFRSHAAALDKKLVEHAADVGYFPVSAIGHLASPQQTDPAHRGAASPISPTGYEPLLDWVFTRGTARCWRWRLKWIGLAIVIALVAAIAALLWDRHIASQQLAFLYNPRLSRLDILKQTTDQGGYLPWQLREEITQQRSQLFEAEIESIHGTTEAAIDEPSLEELLQRLSDLEKLRPGAFQSEINDAKAAARSKKEDLLFQKVNDAFDSQSPDFEDLSARFLREYPGSSRCEKVRDWLGGARGRELLEVRNRIKNLRVVNRAGLGQKSERIVEFLQKFRPQLEPGEADRMQRAAVLAKQFCEVNTYTLRLKRYGGFTTSRSQSLLLFLDGREIHEFEAPTAAKIVTWSGDPLRIEWTAGHPVKVMLRNYTWRNADVAWSEDRSPLALRILGGRDTFAQVMPNWESSVDKPFAHLEVEGISADDWQALEQFIFPGGGW